MPVALVPIVGPDGRPVAQGEAIPKDWDAAYVKTLVADGAAGPAKAWAEIAEAN